METELKKKTIESIVREYSTPLSIIGAAVIIAVSLTASPAPNASADSLQESVLPSAGVTLPVTWGDLGARLVEVGAIDPIKLESLYRDRGGFPAEYRRMLEKNVNERIVITNWNAGYLLNLLWALGLANENPILEDTSEMMNPDYGGAGPPAGGFAATGGWTLSKGPSTGSGQGNAMEHYGKHKLILLTDEQQTLVDRVSRNIYRPCCGNSTHFPDCNHGMAMLGLLELMASQGVNEEDMYKMALAVNSYWFPETYLTIATYMQQNGVAWKDVSPKEMLGANYSSASGYTNISSKVTKPPQGANGGGCSA